MKNKLILFWVIVAIALAGIIANKYFDSQYEVDTKTGIFNVPQVLSDIEITDIYINNNYIYKTYKTGIRFGWRF